MAQQRHSMGCAKETAKMVIAKCMTPAAILIKSWYQSLWTMRNVTGVAILGHFQADCEELKII